MRKLATTVAAVVFLMGAASAVAGMTPKEVRALWVTRGEYRSEDDVKRIVADAASLHFNVILFQVRGNGTVFYKSQIEPWAYELTSNDPATTGKDPGWDPLAVAVEAAKSHGVELHAWVNVFPAWRSQRFPPKDSKQLWWTHPEWFMHDAAGEKMLPRDRRVNPKVADWYAFINPAVPEVQTYLADVCEEIVKNYAVDGLHYDYIRYPREIMEVKQEFRARAKKLGNWSYDAVSMKRFAAETGVARPDDDPDKWFEWRAKQVTATVKTIADRVRPLRADAKKLIISAAVGADPQDSKLGKGQDYYTWLDSGVVDGVFLMGYTDDLEKFTKARRAIADSRPKKGFIAAGVGLRADPAIVVEEVRIARKLGLEGFAGFSYGALFRGGNDRHASKTADKLKEAMLSSPVSPPWRRAGDTME